MIARLAPLAALLLAACAREAPPPPAGITLPAAPAPGLWEAARGVLAKRCVVCHGCYDAPCQLKLSSPEGIRRGATGVGVYDTGRLADAPPTRLHIDARDEAGWRAKGFWPVLPNSADPDPARSLMLRLLELGRARPFAANAPLPEGLALGPDEPMACPRPEAGADYAAAHPHGGMPYAAAPLAEAEHAALADWLRAGAPMPEARPALPPEIAARIAAWEAWLNRPDPRRRLVARFLYEHLFLARFHLEGDAPGRVFRLVRSETPPGQAVREIATRRPFDDPGGAVHYRLRPVLDTILLKDHLVYSLSPARRARWEALFLEPDWEAGPPPGWGVAEGANPFVTFAPIPAESRYRFLLDDALFFVRSFIRGPVCHGQVATDVIEDRFWVAFLAPEADLSVVDPEFLSGAADLLRLPVETAEGGVFARLRPVLHDGHSAWLRYRDAAYAARPDLGAGQGLAGLWDGAGTNAAAHLTVLRNFDNAAVTTGFLGAVPETAWVIDFPLFERIYYDLVAGYDVFGSVEHQLATRLYMDHLRREGEDLFLSFLPAETRAPLHAAWYRGPLAELHASWTLRRAEDARETAVAYETDDPKAELLLRLHARGRGLWADDPVNRCGGDICAGAGAAAGLLTPLASRPGPWVGFLPDVTLLHVRDPEGGEVLTLFRDKAHTNVALLFAEESRREPEKDTVTVLDGQLASYPNFVLEVERAGLADLVDRLRAMETEADWLALVADQGVRRTSPRFWAVIDALHADLAAADPVGAGLLDLARYADPRPE